MVRCCNNLVKQITVCGVTNISENFFNISCMHISFVNSDVWYASYVALSFSFQLIEVAKFLSDNKPKTSLKK